MTTKNHDGATCGSRIHDLRFTKPSLTESSSPASGEVDPAAGIRRHTWRNGDVCVTCGLHREGAGYGPYGAMRYYRGQELGCSYKPGPCTVKP